jgi:hypothetical protein
MTDIRDLAEGIVILGVAISLGIAYSPLAMNRLAAWLRARAYALDISRAAYREAYQSELQARREQFIVAGEPLSITADSASEQV